MAKEMIEVEREKLETIMSRLGLPHNREYQRRMSVYELYDIINPTPTMTVEDWRRVIDEDFYIYHINDERVLYPMTECELEDTGSVRVVREKGLRQPHFKGHPHPDGSTHVLVLFDNGERAFKQAYTFGEGWDDVREYIVLGE